jgi:hypothetical protein
MIQTQSAEKATATNCSTRSVDRCADRVFYALTGRVVAITDGEQSMLDPGSLTAEKGLR